MAKTVEELFEDFKVLSNRPDWTIDDYLSAQAEGDSFILDAIKSVQAVSFIYAASSSVLSTASAFSDQMKSIVDAELARRGI